MEEKQLDESIGDTLVSLDAGRDFRRYSAASIRLANRAKAAIVTDRQSLLVGGSEQSIISASSSQSCAAVRACSGPNCAVTAFINAKSSRSAKWRSASRGM